MKSIFIKIVLLLISCILVVSCLDVHIYEEEAIIVDRLFDPTQQDSVMIHGRVLSASNKEVMYERSTILITETATITQDNAFGYFSVKLQPNIETYTIKCFYDYISHQDL